MNDPVKSFSTPASTRDDATAVVRRLREAGHVAYFAGGCVRDALLGLEPKDYDVATDAPPERVRKLFPRTQAVGAAFGVILVRQGRSQIEVATFRSEGKYLDGRRPETVTFTTAEEDARRRDFTINGLFFDPVENKVIDYVGGQVDLEKKVLRAIGEPSRRFEEDHLRLLRAIRFAARFGLAIEPATGAAMTRHADPLKRISPERIADELRLMLTAVTRTRAWDELWSRSLLTVIFRGLPEKAARPAAGDEDRRPLFPELAPGEPVTFALALASLGLCYRESGVGALTGNALLELPEVRRFVQACRTALRISNEESDDVTNILHVGFLLRDDPPTVATMKRFLATPTSRDARLLLDAMDASGRSRTRVIWLRDQFVRLEQQDVAPLPLITGDDLTAAGLVPGRAFKRALDEAYDAQLEGRVTSKDQALELGLRIARGG